MGTLRPRCQVLFSLGCIWRCSRHLLHAGRVAEVLDTKNTYKGNRGGVERFLGFSAAVPPEKEIIIVSINYRALWSMEHAPCCMHSGE